MVGVARGLASLSARISGRCAPCPALHARPSSRFRARRLAGLSHPAVRAGAEGVVGRWARPRPSVRPTPPLADRLGSRLCRAGPPVQGALCPCASNARVVVSDDVGGRRRRPGRRSGRHRRRGARSLWSPGRVPPARENPRRRRPACCPSSVCCPMCQSLK